MTLATASQLTSRTRCARRASLGALGSLPIAATAAAICHPQQQVRGFRFGRLWSSYFDPEFTSDSCRRQRHFRYRYAETLSRRLSWEQNPPAADDAKPTLKRVLRSYWDPSSSDTRSAGKYVDMDAAPKTPDNPEGIRPGQNIEDAERAPLEDLLFGNKDRRSANWAGKDQSSSPKTHKSKKSRRHGQKRGSFSEETCDYVIDPITNRKVPNTPKGRAYSTPDVGVDIPIRSFKSYRSQFAPFATPGLQDAQAPIFYDGPPPADELRKYSQVKIDAEPWNPASRGLGQTVSSSDKTSAAPVSDILGSIAVDYQEVRWHPSDGITSIANSWAIGPNTSEYKDLDKYNPVADEVSFPPDQEPVRNYEDLDKYGSVRYQEPDGKAPEQELAGKYDDLGKYGPIKSHEPDGKYKADADSAAKEYKDLDKYDPAVSREADGKHQPAEVSKAQDYEDLPQYGAVRSHEPDGKYKAEEDAALPQYDDLNKYGAVKAHEPDGKYKVQQNTFDQPYEDLDKYGAVRAHEPDGKYNVEQSSAEQLYEDLDKYGAVTAHEPDGMYKAEQNSADNQYADLAKYGAIRAHEPDGKYKVEQSNMIAQHYDDLHKYGPVRVDEPDGKYKLWESSAVPQYDDLHKYGAVRAHEPDGIYKAEADASSAISEVDPEELSRYTAFRSHEPDGMYAASYVKPSHDSEELTQYKPFRSHEPDGKYAESYVEPVDDKVELGQYQAFRSHEPDGKYTPSQQVDPAVGYTDLETYGPFRSHEPDGKYAKEHSKSVPLPDELDQYHAVRSHEPDGKYAAQSESTTEVPDLGYHEAFGYEDSETKSPPPGNESVADSKEYKAVLYNEPDGTSAVQSRGEATDPVNLESSRDGEWLIENTFGGLEAVPDEDVEPEQNIEPAIFDAKTTVEASLDPEPEKTDYRKMQELMMSESAAEDSPEHSGDHYDSQAFGKSPGSSKTLTGNYVRDFPEEFRTTWNSRTSDPDSPLLPIDLEPPTYKSPDGFKDSTAKSPNALESALDRLQKPDRSLVGKSTTLDPYSKEPQGLETSYVQECGEKVPVFAKIYGTANIDTGSSEGDSSATTPPAATTTEPTVYKILVYDPTTKSVEIAETSSVISDSTTPSTPADILLRLSNPSKFFPHFGPLQTQGYEIVSGSGDVLIFRKVRDALPASQDEIEPTLASTSTATIDPTSSVSSFAPINPIDMTGGGFHNYSVAASRFASPTGFVNYELPPPSVAPSSPPPSQRLESNIDAHSEDLASTRSKFKSRQKTRDKSSSLPKRMLVGAVWVGGLSYSLVVVSQYFKTGGTDGLGTRGRL